VNVLTFDIEDWFHILDHDSTKTVSSWSQFPSRLAHNTERILELLARHDTTATFFCLGWVAEQHPEVIRRIVAEGHEIATHSYAHQLVYQQSPAEFEADLRKSITILEDLSSSKVRAYRAPGFSITSTNTWAFDILFRNGIEIDCSVFPARWAHGGFPEYGEARPGWIECGGARLKELPINVFRRLGASIVFSGGGYFRLLPYRLIKSLMTRRDYVMTYFHPRDFDAEQPRLPNLPATRRFKSYYGLATSFDKLSKLLADFRFVSLTPAVEATNWEEAPVIEVKTP